MKSTGCSKHRGKAEDEAGYQWDSQDNQQGSIREDPPGYTDSKVGGCLVVQMHA